MADSERPEAKDETPEAGADQIDKKQSAPANGPANSAGPAAQPQGPGQPAAAPLTPVAPSFGGWPSPQPPDVFREFSGSAWPPQQPPMAGPPVGYSAPPGVRTSAPGAGYWPPAGAPPTSAQGGFQGMPGFPPGAVPGAPKPEQPRGVVTTQAPPAKTSPTLFIMLGGLALVVIVVPLLLYLLTRSPASLPTSTAQASPTPGKSTVAPTPTGPWAFTPNGTAPTTKDCNNNIAIPCYSPEQIQQAFSLTPLYKQGITGSGQTIVIIGAGNTSSIKNDLKAFDKAWGLPDPPSFQIIQPFGPPVAYDCNNGVDDLLVENTLDVEWSHAIAPGANIVLVIGANNERKHTPPPNENKCGLDYLEDDVAYALDHHLGNIISISYGGSELGGDNDTAQDKTYEQQEFAAGHAIFQRAASDHVTVLASAGDSGATNGKDMNNPSLYWDTPNVSWPASDPYVLAVGGTTLTIQDANGTYGSEIVWDDAGGGGATGGGLSTLFKEPSYQQKVPNQPMFKGQRGIPDIAFPAETNYSLYLTGTPLGAGDLGQANPKWEGWTLIGGTSASSPCWAGLIALADQMAGQPLGFIHPALYSLQDQGIHDITNGNNNYDIMVGNKRETVQGYQAQPGYDLASGWGTPIADQFIPALIQAVQQVGNTP